MPGKSVEKLLRKLHSRKYRWEHQLFVAEGPKVVKELLDSGLPANYLITTEPVLWQKYNPTIITPKKLAELSQLETANEIIGVFQFPELAAINPEGIVLVLDKINDPGNLGTIIRTCDWFGITGIYCVKGTTDVFNAKCIQSTMGSIARVAVRYGEEEEILTMIENRPLLVADIKGENVFNLRLPDQRIGLVLGNESHGPGNFWKKTGRSITIPKTGNSPIESLNVAQAAAIILGQLSKSLF